MLFQTLAGRFLYIIYDIMPTCSVWRSHVMGHICEQVFRCYYWNNNPQSCLILLKFNCIIILLLYIFGICMMYAVSVCM